MRCLTLPSGALINAINVLVLARSPPTSGLRKSSTVFPLVIGIPMSASTTGAPTLVGGRRGATTTVVRHFVVYSLVGFVFNYWRSMSLKGGFLASGGLPRYGRVILLVWGGLAVRVWVRRVFGDVGCLSRLSVGMSLYG